jgi:hypothetical protein
VLQWTRIVAYDIRWSGDSQHFTVPTATGTEIRDRQFNVVQTFNHLREADWLDDSHVVGYLSETENVLPAKRSGATPEVVTLGSVGSVTTNMPIGFGPFASRHGAAVVRVPTDPRSYNDHFVVWSADGSVSKDQDGWTSEWSRDGSKLVVEIQRSPFSGATKVLTWPAMTSLYASDEEHESAGGAQLDPSGRYLAVWTSLFRGYVTGPWLHIVDFETGHDSEVLFEQSDTGQFTFWTADTHLSVDDGKQVQVFDTIGQLVETYEPPLAVEGEDVPISTASADGSSIAFTSEYTPRDIALIRDGVTSFIVPPVTGELGNYASFSPDGSVLIVQPGGDSGSLYLANI